MRRCEVEPPCSSRMDYICPACKANQTEAAKAKFPFRAFSYSRPQGRGVCAHCCNAGCNMAFELYFVHNPHGDDELVCNLCQKAAADYYQEFSPKSTDFL